MTTIIDGERDRIREHMGRVQNQFPEVRDISWTGGDLFPSGLSVEVRLTSRDRWPEIKRAVRSYRLVSGVRWGRVCYSEVA